MYFFESDTTDEDEDEEGEVTPNDDGRGFNAAEDPDDDDDAVDPWATTTLQLYLLLVAELAGPQLLPKLYSALMRPEVRKEGGS